jgi:hypothetical protein
LRCSAAINLVDAGVPEDIVMKIGGWKTKAMFSRYNVMNSDAFGRRLSQVVRTSLNGLRRLKDSGPIV